MKVTIGHLYPDLFNLYGDSVNVQCMKKRLVWRGMEAEVLPLGAGEEIDFGKLDILVWGGGSDRGQALAVDYLNRIQPDFKQYVEDGGVVLAVCGAFQLLGKYYKAGEEYDRKKESHGRHGPAGRHRRGGSVSLQQGLWHPGSGEPQ